MPSNESAPRPAAEVGARAPSGTSAKGNAEHHADLYDRFAERVREIFDAGQEKSKEAMEKAMDLAREQLSAAGEFTAEQGEAFKQFMRRDLEQTARDMRALGHETRDRLHPARLEAGALSSMARVLEAAGLALHSLARKAENALRYTTGDITTAGTLTCVSCGQEVQLKRTSKIPPCPKCHGSDFRKGY